MVIVKKLRLILLGVALGISTAAPAADPHRGIELISYGLSTPEAIRGVGFSSVRGKLDAAGKIASSFATTIAVLRNSNVDKIRPDAMVVEAQEYATASALQHLREISIDDFVGWYISVKRSGNTSVFESIARVAHSAKPRLRLGVTVYEEQLSAQIISVREIPGSHASLIDRVYLYFHQRPSCTNMANYAADLRAKFPQAEIVVGLYNQDRRDYEKRRGTEDEEIALFQTCFAEAQRLASKGTIVGIEIYPSRIGLEATTFGIGNPSTRVAIEMNRVLLKGVRSQ